MRLRTLDNACDFVRRWHGLPADLPGTTELHPDCPVALARLNARLGAIWGGAAPEAVADLFDGQDRIADPHDLPQADDGAIPFIEENQTVWQVGFDPADPGRIRVRGDWADGSGDTWRPVDASPEDALIYTLISNLVILSSTEDDWMFDPAHSDPQDDLPHLLWDHPAWTGFGGFWTNADGTEIQFRGLDLIVLKP